MKTLIYEVIVFWEDYSMISRLSPLICFPFLQCQFLAQLFLSHISVLSLLPHTNPKHKPEKLYSKCHYFSSIFCVLTYILSGSCELPLIQIPELLYYMISGCSLNSPASRLRNNLYFKRIYLTNIDILNVCK